MAVSEGCADDPVREYAPHNIRHIQKALRQMNIKLQYSIGDITGVTGMKIIEAIVKGERNPHKLAGLRHRTMRATEDELAESLRGHW